MDSGFSRLPISIVEFVLSQGWMIVIRIACTVLAYLLIETPAGIRPGAALLLFCFRGTNAEDFGPSSSKVSCENSPLGYLI